MHTAPTPHRSSSSSSSSSSFPSKRPLHRELALAHLQQGLLASFASFSLVGFLHAKLSFKMPATAGRVRMPANNRVHSSAALQTHGIWQSAIGYDPYAPEQKQQADDRPAVDQNAYDSFQGLLALARLTASNADEARGSCKKCGRVGHLTFQCRNFLTVKEEEAAVAAAALVEKAGLNRKEKRSGGGSSSSEETSEDESEISESEVDSEMERAIAARYGKSFLKIDKSSSHKKERNGKPKHKKSSRSSSKRGISKRHRKDSSTEDSTVGDDSSDSDSRNGSRSLEERRKKRSRLDSSGYSKGDGKRKRQSMGERKKKQKHIIVDSHGSSDSNRKHRKHSGKKHARNHREREHNKHQRA